MIPNINPETGIRYGVVSLNSLQDWVWEEFEYKGELLTEVDDEAEDWPEEPAYELEVEDMKLQLGWLGGAPLVWVLKSPHTTRARECSPCVPNAGDLDSLDEGGFECYTLPEDWFYKEEQNAAATEASPTDSNSVGDL